MSRSKNGFTLIELLVVIAIIGVLASVILPNLNAARVKARSARRAADLKQIQTALELYYADNNSYPNPGWAWRSQCAAWGGYTQDQVIPGLVPAYMASFPSDPSMKVSNSTACYLYLSNGVDYKILDHNIVPAESSSFTYQTYPNLIDPGRDSGLNSCVVDGTGIWSWAVFTPGGACW